MRSAGSDGAGIPLSANLSSHAAIGAPSPWVLRWAPLVQPGGAVLDVASGGGRHAASFADRGHAVLAVDRDTAALTALAQRMPAVSVLQVDLEQGGWPLPAEQQFDAIVVTNYLHRPLWPHLLAALAENGVLIYETFAIGNETVGRPSNPDFLLRPGELLALVDGNLRVVAYEDGFISAPKPAFVQRLCAVREGQQPVPVRYPLDAA